MLAYAKYQVVLPTLERVARRLFDYDLRRIRIDQAEAAAGADMRRQVDELQTLVDLFVENPRYAWLYKNRTERMDATLPFFDERRRNFHLARYHFAAPYAAGKTVVDAACGTGYGAELLRKQGQAQRVTGVDIDAEAIDYAQEVHGGAGIEFLCASADATGLPDEAVDLVTSFETIEHVPDDRALLRELHRVLRPGGLFICSTPNNWPLAIAPYHVREYDRDSFLAVVSEFFTAPLLFNQNSGSDWEFNRGQAAGIVPTTERNHALAECFVVVCRKAG